MTLKRSALLVIAAAVGLTAYVVLDFYSDRNAPLHKRLERLWAQDLRNLEESNRLPPQWQDVGEVELFGGTPQTKNWLKRIHVPIRPKKADGQHKLEVLVVAWEEEGVQGALVQYNLVDRKTQNMIFELGRTLILHDPNSSPLEEILEEVRQ